MMATDEYLWSLVLQEAASGTLEFEFLNDEQSLSLTPESSNTSHTVPCADINNDSLFDELFDLNCDATLPIKPDFDAAFTSMFPEDVADLAQSILFTESYSWTDDVKPEPLTNGLPVCDKPLLKAATISDQQYMTENSKPLQLSSVKPSDEYAQEVPIAGLSADILANLLSSISSVQHCEMEDVDVPYDENLSECAENSADCSEFEEYEHEKQVGCYELSKTRHKGIDRKQRKMQQNRVAAHRYRLKKKAEQGAVANEREKLEKYNTSLKVRVQQMTQEIGYLRSLMNDMIKLRAAKR